MFSQEGEQKKVSRICARQPVENDNLCMFYALENALQETGCLNQYLNPDAKNSHGRFANLIRLFSKIIAKQFEQFADDTQQIEELLLGGADPSFVEAIITDLGFNSKTLALTEFLQDPAVIANAFAAILGLIGEQGGRGGSLAHFIAWVSSTTPGKPTDGFLLDSLKADQDIPTVDLADWLHRNQTPPGNIVLPRSSVTIIWKKINPLN